MASDQGKMKEELKKIVNQQKMELDFKIAQEQRNTDRAKRDAIAKDELNAGRYVKDAQGKDIPLSDKVISDADHVMNEDVHAYNDFRSAMMGLIKLYKVLNQDIHQSMKDIFDTLATPIVALGRAGADKARSFYANKIGINWYNDEPKDILPKLQHAIDLNEKNEISYAPLTGEAGAEIDPIVGEKLDELFQHGVEKMWLDSCGFEPQAANSKIFVTKDTKQVLVEAEFNTLKEAGNDKGPSLDAFLSGNFDLKFSETPSPRPK